jgi:prevent-host-death family protein
VSSRCLASVIIVEANGTTYTGPVQISAAKFKATCLKLIDRVAKTGEPVIITKRGKVLARLASDHGKPRGLGKGRGCIEILCSDEELFQLGAGEPWDPPARAMT